jgi:hypothetical protein
MAPAHCYCTFFDGETRDKLVQMHHKASRGKATDDEYSNYSFACDITAGIFTVSGCSMHGRNLLKAGTEVARQSVMSERASTGVLLPLWIASKHLVGQLLERTA